MKNKINFQSPTQPLKSCKCKFNIISSNLKTDRGKGRENEKCAYTLYASKQELNKCSIYITALVIYLCIRIVDRPVESDKWI